MPSSDTIREGVEVHTVRLGVGPLDVNCWIVTDEAQGPAVIIDPGGDSDAIVESLGSNRVAAIVLTHGHFDHLGAVRPLMQATGAPLLVHANDAASITTPETNGGALFGFSESAPEATRVLEDGDEVVAGVLRFEVLHTPGHTPGGICLLARDPEGGAGHLFSGDTLFAGSVGRTDFPGGDARTLSRSIAEKIATLAPSTVVHPGHGPDTTIARELRRNPFFPRT